MNGVILAGGKGTRLGLPYNKHAAIVYDKPMIEYPIQSMREMEVDEITIVTSPNSTRDIFKSIKDPSNVNFRVQEEPKGAADALRVARGIKGVFPVLCGDVYFDPAPPISDVPALIYHEFEGAQNHTVWNSETNELVEKPIREMGRRAIVAYWFDEQVFDFIETIQPSERGETELIDIYRFYLGQGVPVLEHKGFFGDMGTPNGLLRVANYEQNRTI
jgi:glucose-1-phosphate thymidylyltransferase